jgi:spore germination protein GerM
MPGEFMVPVVKRVYDRQVTELRAAFNQLIAPAS